MKIINHGRWVPYKSDRKVDPLNLAAFPVNVMFCRRDTDKADWYDYQRNPKVFQDGSIKATVFEGTVQAVNRDASFLFPQNCLLIEIIDDDVEDAFEKYHGMLYDGARLSVAPPPPPVVNPVDELIKRVEKLEAQLKANKA